MARPRIFAIAWKHITRVFRRPNKVLNEEANNLLGGLIDEAPLHTDGFSNHMRSLQDSFFE